MEPGGTHTYTSIYQLRKGYDQKIASPQKHYEPKKDYIHNVIKTPQDTPKRSKKLALTSKDITRSSKINVMWKF